MTSQRRPTVVRLTRYETAQVSSVVVLDRIVPGWTPPYCTHGRATCVGGCGEWVWLGNKSGEEVAAGRVAPICVQCAERLTAPDVARTRRIEDHRRADGPHEGGG